MRAITCSTEETTDRPKPAFAVGFFSFKHVVLTSPPKPAQDHAARAMEPWALPEFAPAAACTVNGVKSAAKGSALKNRHMLWFLALVVLMQLSQLMAKNDDHHLNWTPPIEPPGSIIVTSLTESSQRPESKRTAYMARMESAAEASATPGQVPGMHPTSEAALRQALEQWSQAWSAQAVSQYLGMYAQDFTPAKGLTRTVWAQQRTQRIQSKQNIRHEVHDLTVQIQANLATVRFTQIYQDERLRKTDPKIMQWALRDGQWRITLETTG